MEIFDLGIAWNSQQDNDFVNDLNNQALKYGLKPYLIHAFNFYGSLKDIADDKLFFKFFLDRTSQDDHAFNGLASFLKKKGSIFINHPDNSKKSADKILAHEEFSNHNIPVPKAFFLNCDEDCRSWELKLKDINPELFVFKPVNITGNGEKNLDIKCYGDILQLRQNNDCTKYFVQEKVSPINLGDRPAWFKVLYCLGEVIPCWWQPSANSYEILSKEETDKFRLFKLWELTKRIKQLCKLCFFSTEIALRNNNEFVVINYVNAKPDMRKKSKFNDGIPDEAVNKVIERCSLFAKSKI